MTIGKKEEKLKKIGMNYENMKEKGTIKKLT